jgi:hypothetical protein
LPAHYHLLQELAQLCREFLADRVPGVPGVFFNIRASNTYLFFDKKLRISFVKIKIFQEPLSWRILALGVQI